MGKSFIKCPKDPEIQYYREVCKEVFRKGNTRNWCKQCEVFQEQKESAGKAQQVDLTNPFKVSLLEA